MRLPFRFLVTSVVWLPLACQHAALRTGVVVLAPGLEIHDRECRHPGGSVRIREIAVGSGSGLRLSVAENASSVRESGAGCVQQYPGGRPSALLEAPAWRSRGALALANASLFHSRPSGPGPAPRHWEADGLAWSAAGALDDRGGLQAPLQFNECREGPVPVLVADEGGIHALAVPLLPCPGARPPPARAPRSGTGAGASGSEPWCGGERSQSLRARRHEEACGSFRGRTLRSRELVAALRREYPEATAVIQVTGPWALNLIPGEGDHPLRCREGKLAGPGGLLPPVNPGIEAAICGPAWRTAVCARSDGSFSLAVAEPVGLHDLGTALAGCGLDCEQAFAFDGGGSSQLAYVTPDGTVEVTAAPIRGPREGERACGPARAPVNFFVIHRPSGTPR